ncbi:MAG: glycosyltransferase, partial [Lentisphaeria bacterium]|nr:glycosyltransferase [Lentisphaeria bacterium]
MTDKKTVAISCGGTGGHFYPGITIAEKFRENGGTVVLF